MVEKINSMSKGNSLDKNEEVDEDQKQKKRLRVYRFHLIGQNYTPSVDF